MQSLSGKCNNYGGLLIVIACINISGIAVTNVNIHYFKWLCQLLHKKC